MPMKSCHVVFTAAERKKKKKVHWGFLANTDRWHILRARLPREDTARAGCLAQPAAKGLERRRKHGRNVSCRSTDCFLISSPHLWKNQKTHKHIKKRERKRVKEAITIMAAKIRASYLKLPARHHTNFTKSCPDLSVYGLDWLYSSSIQSFHQPRGKQ